MNSAVSATSTKVSSGYLVQVKQLLYVMKMLRAIIRYIFMIKILFKNIFLYIPYNMRKKELELGLRFYGKKIQDVKTVQQNDEL